MPNDSNPNAPASSPAGIPFSYDGSKGAPVFDPRGKMGYVPHEELQDALSNNYKMAVRVRHPQNGLGWLPANEVDTPEAKQLGIERYDAGGSQEILGAAEMFGKVLKAGAGFAREFASGAKEYGYDFPRDMWNEANERAGAQGPGGNPLFELPGLAIDKFMDMHRGQADRAYAAADALKKNPNFATSSNYLKEALGTFPGLGPPARDIADTATTNPGRALGKFAALAVGEKVGKYAPGLETVAKYTPGTAAQTIDAMGRDVDAAHQGIARTLAALKTPPGKAGIRGQAMTRDVGDIAAGDVAKIFRDSPEATKSFGAAAEAVGNYKNKMWDEQYQPFIDQYGAQPTHGEAFTKAHAEFAPGTDNLADAAGARKWIADEQLDQPRTIADARAKLTRLNQEPSSPVNPSSDLLSRVKEATKSGLRDEIDNALINDTREPAIRGVSQRYGALRDMEGQLRVKAQQFRDQSPTLLERMVPSAIHAYMFAHGMGIPAAGLGLNLGRVMRDLNAPPRVLRRGLTRMSGTSLAPPEPIEPSGGNLPSQIWGQTPPPQGPIRGLLPSGIRPPRPGPEPPQGVAGGLEMPPSSISGRDIPPVEIQPRAENRQLPRAGAASGPQTVEGPSSGAAKIIKTSPGAALGSGNIGKMDMPASGTAGTYGGPPPQTPSTTLAPYLTGQHEFTLLSAEDPQGAPFGSPENRVRTASTIKELSRLGYKPQIVEGIEDGRGGTNSVFVPGMSTQDALAFQEHMRTRFGHTPQQNIITKQGLVDTGSKRAVPIDFSRTKFGPDAEAQPYHSVATGAGERLPFALSINGDAPRPIKAPFEGVHYTNHSMQDGDLLLGSRRGAINPKLGRPESMDAARVHAGNGAPPGSYFYSKDVIADPQMSGNTHAYTVRGDYSIATLEDSPHFAQAYKQTYDEATSKGLDEKEASGLAANAGEHAVRNAGYDGWTSKQAPNTVFLYGDHPVVKPGTPAQQPELTPHPNLPQQTTPPTEAAAATPPQAGLPNAPVKKAAAPAAKKPGSPSGGPGPTSKTGGATARLPKSELIARRAAELARSGKTPDQIGATLMREFPPAPLPESPQPAKLGSKSAQATK